MSLGCSPYSIRLQPTHEVPTVQFQEWAHTRRMNRTHESLTIRKITAFVALGATALAGLACGAGPSAAETSAQIKALLSSGRVGAETLGRKAAVSKFYEARADQPAWTGKASDIVAAIRGMEADGLDPADYHLKAIEARMTENGAQAGNADDAAALDILLSDAVALMADDVRFGRVRPSQVNPAWNADPRDGAGPLDSTLTVVARSVRVSSAIDGLRPDHFIYKGLRGALARLHKVEDAGGWGTVPAGKALSPGAVDRRVAAVRRYLTAAGELRGSAPRDSTRYDPALARAVKAFQARHRVEDTGVIGPATIAAMNVSVRARIDQVRANLERARWVLGGLGQDFLLVNLPAYKAYLIQGNRNVWESRTQIGQEAMQTPTFRANIQTIVFNPDWSVPQSIALHEIVPAMQSGRNVLREQGLVAYDAENREVDPKSIDWDDVDSTNFQYSFKQPPSGENALGKVKFLFPNKYAIYLHDTPSRHLFETGKRAFSHGCIRIENPLDLAERLLDGQDRWSRSRMEDTIAADSTVNVTLEHPLPILIVYWTVSVGGTGEVRYAQDIYDLDGPLVAALDRSSRSR